MDDQNFNDQTFLQTLIDLFILSLMKKVLFLAFLTGFFWLKNF